MSLFAILPAWAWILISTSFFALGEYYSKRFALNPGWAFFFVILVVDIISVSTWLPAIFEKNHLSTTGVIWSVMSLLLTALLGIIIFEEKITFLQILGIIFGILSVSLLSV